MLAFNFCGKYSYLRKSPQSSGAELGVIPGAKLLKPGCRGHKVIKARRKIDGSKKRSKSDLPVWQNKHYQKCKALLAFCAF